MPSVLIDSLSKITIDLGRHPAVCISSPINLNRHPDNDLVQIILFFFLLMLKLFKTKSACVYPGRPW